MSHYTFDVHDDGPAEWGEPGYACAGHDEIEHHTRDLITQAQERQAARGPDLSLTTVFVHEDGDGIVLTAYGRPDGNVRLVWTPG